MGFFLNCSVAELESFQHCMATMQVSHFPTTDKCMHILSPMRRGFCTSVHSLLVVRYTYIIITAYFLQVTETPERVCKETPTRNAPRIAAFIGEESQQYFVLIEQNVLCQVSSFQFAIFILFSAYYAFHLEYPMPVKNVLHFFSRLCVILP